MMSNVKSVLTTTNLSAVLKAIPAVVQELLPKDQRQSRGTIYDEIRSPTKTRIAVPSDLGVLLKSLRKSKGLTQQQFADLSGVGRRFIVECEAGKPRLEFAKVLQVAAAAGIDIIAQKR